MSDVSKWERRYQRREHGNDPTPDSVLVEYSGLFKRNQLVVDLACGTGRNTIYLAKLGCFTVALDISQEALRRCQSLAEHNSVKLHPIAADLTHYRLPDESTDAIVCFNYLNRKLARNIQSALKPDGLLLMRTFNVNFLKRNSRFNPNYVLNPGELSSMFDGMNIVSVDDDCEQASTTKSFIIARKSSTALTKLSNVKNDL